MDADFSIELGREDPVLDFPWKDPAGTLAYVDLRCHPELMAQIEEAEEFPELREFLRAMNSARSMVETAKCDVWSTTELSPEEELFRASYKYASYVDVVLSNIDARLSLPAHEQFVRKLIELLRRTPETPSAAEVCVRRCYFEEDGDVREGYYFTLYVSGYGKDDVSARLNWGVGLKLMGNAVLQLSAGGAG
ncbi:MAG TPA: hypothetical protein VKH18_12850 [Terriglobales bacterium]|nr:hypothetical protein [Terriglobales bacterium]